MNDERLFNYNIDQKAETFAQEMYNRSLVYQTDQIFVTFGCDFRYQNAIMNFLNMEKLMQYINNNSTFNMTLKYSTPSIYLEAVHSTPNLELPLKQDDFFPYSSQNHTYWTGYFTSRPAFKGYVRTRSNLYQAAHKLYFSTGVNDSTVFESILDMLDPLGIVQHHDAVTGTEQQHVNDDYAKRLSMGTSSLEFSFSSMFGSLIGQSGEFVSNEELTFAFCEYLNQSICPALNFLNSSELLLPIYNPIAWDRSEYIRLPVMWSDVQVFNKGEVIPSYIIPCEDESIVGVPYTLIFLAKLPPMGFETYYLTRNSDEDATVYYDVVDNLESDITMENEFLILEFSSQTNNIASVFDKTSGQYLDLNQTWFWYNASNGEFGQQSGAYVFRPNSSTPFPVGEGLPSLSIIRSSDGNIQEARQVWSPWVNQTYRLYSGQPYIEIEATIGPIPFEDDFGKEVVTRYSTNITNNATWFTDSQGLELQKRIRNYRPTWNLTQFEPVAGNYFPFDTHTHINNPDDPNQLQFSVVADRSRGCASLVDGQLETMIHRRLLVIQGGVDQPLNESTIIRTVQNVIVTTPSASPSATSLERWRALLLNHPVIIGFSQPLTSVNLTSTPSFSPLQTSLPPNVHLQTVEVSLLNPLYNTLLRLHHIFGIDEDPIYSTPVSVDLNTLFEDFVPVSIVETSLTANQPLKSVSRMKWNADENTSKWSSTKDDAILDYFVIELQPMEIRTFLVNFEPRGL
eukprot:TRINITY_DN5339_c0_g2_i1.p1 TRINITY_DN5339_c0_g2~~TRINITY_DN5339_c0_g2_i1.p1  ORF type:complete len:739 (+),score=160.21 TRINITY_DN5339_c0_g2_i1:334-2550(+)